MSKAPILFTFGRTGGHIYPAIAIAQSLPKNESKFLAADHFVAKNIFKKYNLSLDTFKASGGPISIAKNTVFFSKQLANESK